MRHYEPTQIPGLPGAVQEPRLVVRMFTLVNFGIDVRDRFFDNDLVSSS